MAWHMHLLTACTAAPLLLVLLLCARRYVHPMHLHTGVEGVSKQAPALPSDKDHNFTYGKPAAYRCGRAVLPAQHMQAAACSMCSPSTSSSSSRQLPVFIGCLMASSSTVDPNSTQHSACLSRQWTPLQDC